MRSTHRSLPLVPDSLDRRDLEGYWWIWIWTRSGPLLYVLLSLFDFDVPLSIL